MHPLPVDDLFVQALEREGRLPQGTDRSNALLKAFLLSDFHVTSTGSLPKDVKSISGSILKGRYVLQIDEIVNISAPLKGRFEEKGRDRMLKLHMTDGKQQVVGIEYRNISDLKVLSPAGIKVAVTDVFVNAGILMLCQENVDVLGGSVERLVKAQEATKAALMKAPRPGRERESAARRYEDAELCGWEFEYRPSPNPAATMRSNPPHLQPIPPPARTEPTTAAINNENLKPIVRRAPVQPKPQSKHLPSRARQRTTVVEDIATEVIEIDCGEPIPYSSSLPAQPPSVQAVIDLLEDE